MIYQPACLLGDGSLVTSDHLNLDAVGNGSRNRRFGVDARRVEQREHALELPLAGLAFTRVGNCDPQRAKPPVSELLYGRGK